MIEKKLIDFELLPFSQRDKDYNAQSKQLASFITEFPSVESLISQAKTKQQSPINRKLLVSTLKRQYKGVSQSQQTLANIESLLQDNTFTVITAHQPSLLTGPLYFIFKILNCINLAEELNAEQQEFDFVPVFVSGGEDHDFDEIATFKLFKETIEWQAESGGPVGRMPITGLDKVLEQTIDILGPRSQALDLISTLQGFLTQATNYNSFQRLLVNHLFGKYGIIYFSTDDDALKQELAPIFKKELVEQVSKPLVTAQQEKLRDLSYTDQAYARDINIFYIKDGLRERIESIDGSFQVLNTDITFSTEDIDDHLTHFSPNVVLRPLCQEYLLPNVVYIGGGGELAYWVERKLQFEAFDIPFPILMRRNSAGLISQKQLKSWEQLGFTTEDMFKPTHVIANQFLENSDTSFDLSVQRTSVEETFASIKALSEQIDKSISSSVDAAKVKELKVIDQLEARIKRSVKQKYDVDLNKLNKVQETISPNGKLQERSDNIVTYISKYGIGLIDDIKDNLDPITDKFTLLILQ